MANVRELVVIDAHELIDRDLPPPKFCVDTLLPHGLSILGGAPKTGKSWLVLDLCVRVAKGEPLWNLQTQQSSVLDLCLEDGEKRVQQRLLTLTDELPEGRLYLATHAGKLSEDLCDQICGQLRAHPDIRLVVVDTFQMVRGGETDNSYAADYEDMRNLQQLADEEDVALLLVHHLRKRGDSDQLNKLSGTTGITGAADAVFILDRNDRLREEVKLIATGRDIESRELTLLFDSGLCRFTLLGDSMDRASLLLPEELVSLVELMKSLGSFTGSNTELAAELGSRCGVGVQAKGLKQMMNRYRRQLETEGVRFRSYRSNGQRLVEVSFSAVGSDASDGSAAEDVGDKACVPSVPCVPGASEAPGRAKCDSL